jgi:hypothetical protein
LTEFEKVASKIPFSGIPVATMYGGFAPTSHAAATQIAKHFLVVSATELDQGGEPALKSFNRNWPSVALDIGHLAEFNYQAIVAGIEGERDFLRPKEKSGELSTREVEQEIAAVALLSKYPDWSDAQIARSVPCNRTSLYRWPKYMAIKAALNGTIASGVRDSDTGQLDAIGDGSRSDDRRRRGGVKQGD